MALFKLCSDDPVTSQLRDVFKANILRIPEERIAPLTILASTKRAVRFIGYVGSLLDGPPFEIPSADLKESDMATLTNRRSRIVDSEIGLQILSGLLEGLGGGAAPEVSAHFNNEKTFRFHFPAVQRRYVELARIGQLLAGRSFNHKNLCFKTLVDSKVTVRLIDSVITSTGFEIEAGEEGEASLKIDPLALKKALADAKIEVIMKDGKHLGFRSSRRLTFAFTCLNVSLSANGAIRGIAPSADKVGPPQLVDPRDRDRGLDAHVLLTRIPEFIELEDAP